MALQSPGVEITVIDESFYTPAEPGTTPLIVVATAQDKANAAGTGTAAATTKANAGVAYRLTSQKDLVDLFGVPFFERTASGSPVHGGERNEYGLLAAYSLLGVSNSVFIVRADVNLAELEAEAAAPGAEPNNGQWWVDTASTSWGIQEWNGADATTTGGQKFTAKTPIVLTDDDDSKIENNKPRTSVGSIGDYAVIFETGDAAKESAKIYYKSPGGTIANAAGIVAGQWVLVGSPEWCASHPTVMGGVTVTSLNAGDTFIINGNTVTIPVEETVDQLVININSTLGSSQGISARNVEERLYIYSDGSTSTAGDSSLSGAIVIAAGSGSALTDLGIDAGTYLQPKLTQSPHTQVPTYKRTENSTTVAGYPTGSIWMKTTAPNNGARYIVKRWSRETKTWQSIDAPLYASGHSAIYYLDRAGGGGNINVNSLFVQYNSTEDYSYAAPDDVEGRDATLGEAQYRIWRRASVDSTSIVSAEIANGDFTNSVNYTFTIKESVKGQLSLAAAKTVSFIGTTSIDGNGNAIAAAVNAANFTNIVASYDAAANKVTISHKLGGEFRLTDGTNSPLGILFTPYDIFAASGTANYYDAPSGAAEDYIASNWKPLASEDFIASDTAPLNEPEDGQLWYNPNFGQVDIMVHNGTYWKGYRNVYPLTDPNGPIVSASEPADGDRSDGGNLVEGDLWISTADLENFPTIYRWDNSNNEWVLIDKTDQTTADGVLFADARWSDTGGTINEPYPAGEIVDMLTSDFLDPDAPDPDLYPKGMLLYNTRRSGGNVKRYANGYINPSENNPRFKAGSPDPTINVITGVGDLMSGYASDRWVTASANNEDGSGAFGRKAQRKVVVSAIKSVIDTSEQIRDEERRNFNLIACPGYPEALSNLINLNIDRKLTAFVVGDTPLRLSSDATTLVNWGTNAALVTDNGDDGIVSYDEYAAVWYPNGFTTDLGGNNVVVPASHMMLRTIALSDQVSYPWFAPAGTRRGGITNATSVGYIDASTGEFQTVALNEGTRDVLYDLKVNPIPFFVGVGLVAFGQKTRARNASALDRINVARLVVYLRSQLAKLARPYIFEPNDKITRDEVKGAVESLLLELVGLRALYDFAVVCDETNNTPSRIDRNELWVDIAIEPVKAVEFIYIPLRVKNTGEI